MNIQRVCLVAQTIKNLPAMQVTQVQSLGQKDPLEKGMVTHSSTNIQGTQCYLLKRPVHANCTVGWFLSSLINSVWQGYFSGLLLCSIGLPVQFSSVAQSCPTLCDPMDCSMPGFSVHHQLLEFTQTHVHWDGDAIQTSHLSSPSPPAFNLSQHQGLFQWVSSSHQVAKILEFQLQHQSFQWIFRIDFL